MVKRQENKLLDCTVVKHRNTLVLIQNRSRIQKLIRHSSSAVEADGFLQRCCGGGKCDFVFENFHRHIGRIRHLLKLGIIDEFAGKRRLLHAQNILDFQGVQDTFGQFDRVA